MGLLNLFRPKWRHSSADVRRDALSGITDAEVLVDIIVGDGEWFVRHEAFAALRDLGADETSYRRLVRESGDEEIRRKAVKVMTDVPELERVAREDQYLYIREAAEHRLDEIRTGIWNNLPQ